MQLRLATSRLIRCFPRTHLWVTGTQNFERCICTVQHNLKPVTWNLSAIYYQQYRFKRKRSKNFQRAEEESDSDDEDEMNDKVLESNDQYEAEPGAKIITYKLENPRVDRLLRKALNISGKSVENLFYDKKIQVNGEVLMKKGHQVDKGDIITVPLGETTGKTAHGALIEILEIIEHENNYSIKVSRNKNTLVSV